MNDMAELNETYFRWLCADAFTDAQEAATFEGVARELHDIPFYWTMWLDENRAGDALSFRQSDFLSFYNQEALLNMDQLWLGQWATASPSVFEVLLGIARRWSFYYENPPNYYFGIMFSNLGLFIYPGDSLLTVAKEDIRNKMDTWMNRQFRSNGIGSPFPVHRALDIIDMRTLDIWGQMNAYSAEHFQ